MKFKHLIIALSSIFLTIQASSSYSGPFSEHVDGEDGWLYSEVAENADKALKEILTRVDTQFNQAVSNYVISNFFGGSKDPNIKSLVGIIPQLNITALVFPSGPSETQVMLQILLAAMEEMKEEIIDAVDANYQDETEANLNTVIYEVGSYNLRPAAERKRSYGTLFHLKTLAQYVKERIATREDKAIENLHLYMLAASVQFEIEREYTRWLTLDTNPTASNEYIQSRIDDQFRYFLDGIFEYVNNDVIGEVATWRAAYEDSFSSPSDYQFSRTVQSGTVTGCTTVRGVKTCTTSPVYKHLYKYYMNNIPVEFEVKQTSSVSRLVYFGVYNAEGTSTDTISCPCIAGSSTLLTRLKASSDPIDDHKASSPALAAYIRLGYDPAAEILDAWWYSYYGSQRPHSEVDTFISTH